VWHAGTAAVGPLRLGRAAELRWLSTRRRHGIGRRLPSRQWPLTGKLYGDIDQPELADCRQHLRILEWRLSIFRLRKRPQARRNVQDGRSARCRGSDLIADGNPNALSFHRIAAASVLSNDLPHQRLRIFRSLLLLRERRGPA
jgi:hypothetical protein